MKLINSNRFYLKGTDNRFLHLGTVIDNLKEYMCFTDRHTGSVYIEEVTGGSLYFIEDDSRAKDLEDFLREKGVLEMSKPILSDSEWLRNENKPI